MRPALVLSALGLLVTGGVAALWVALEEPPVAAAAPHPEGAALQLAAEADRFLNDTEEAMTSFLSGDSPRSTTNERLRWGGYTFFSLHRREGALTEPRQDTPAREALSDAIGLGLYGTGQARSCVNEEDHATCRDAHQGLQRARDRLADFRAALAAS